MSSELDQKRPLSPQQLFQRLISGDFTEIECIDQVAQVKQQRQILISLITEYRLEISKKMEQYRKLQEFLEIRNKLRSQLEVLRQDRISIDKNIQYELNSNRISHTQVADISVRRAEIDQIRFKNAGLQGRLRELSQYCLKIEKHNQILQQQKRMGMEYEMRTRSNSDLVYSTGCNCDGGHRGHGGCGWGQRYSAIKTQQQNLTTNMMRKIREKEQQNIKHVRMQQQQIAQRNRRKMQAFHERMRKYH